MAWDGVNLTDLNNFMKNYASGIIVPDQYVWGSLYDALKANVKKNEFRGDAVEQLIQTTHPFTGTAFGENVDIPYPQPLGFTKNWIPLKEVIVNAGLTRQALQRATGGDASWGRSVDAVLRAQREEFRWLMELASIGDGTGRLARSSAGGAYEGSSSISSTGKHVTITCDNTYCDFGWENVALLKKGMWVEAYLNAGTRSAESTTYAWKVCDVTFGNRANSTPQAGTFKIEVNADINAQFDDGTVIYLAGTRSKTLSDFAGTGVGSPARAYWAENMQATYDVLASLPMGLVGIVADNVNATKKYQDGVTESTHIQCQLDTFQGLARASYPTLNSKVYNGADLGGAKETPEDWSLSVISDAMNQTESDTGGKTDLLLCSSELAMAINRQNRSEQNFTVNISNSTGVNQNAVGAMYANKFLCPDGRVIPIMVSKTIPRNVLYGLCTEDLDWYTKGNFDFLKLNGEVWDKSYDDRKANFEAPFGGYSQLGARRCDRHWVIQDMKDNI